MEPQKPEERPYQKQIFKALNLSEDESKYITVERDVVYIVLPIEAEFNVSIGNKVISSDMPDVSMETGNLFRDIDGFLTNELHKGGFKLNGSTSFYKYSHNVFTGDAEFYKDITNDEEAKETVKWLMEFKKRFSI